MITSRQRIQYILSAGLLASAAFGASAQTPPAAGPAGTPPAAEHRMHKPDGKFVERMQERRAKHLADLKSKLKIGASQEAAWSAYTAASQPPGPPPQGRDPKAARAEFDKLTTPQRLDRMQARQAEHAALFAKRAESTRTFYTALTPEQQKTFDAESLRHGPRGEHGPRGPRGHGGHGGHGGPDGHRPPPPPPAKG